MSAPGATQSDCEMTFAFFFIKRNQELHQAFDLVKEGNRSGLIHDKRPHFGIVAIQAAKLVDEERVRYEPDIEHKVETDWRSILEAEGHQRNRHFSLVTRRCHDCGDYLTQLMDGKRAGIDNAVGSLAHLRQR